MALILLASMLAPSRSRRAPGAGSLPLLPAEFYGASGTTIVIRPHGPFGPRSLAEASRLPCAAPCTLAFESLHGEPIGPQAAERLRGTPDHPIIITSTRRRREVIDGSDVSADESAVGRPYEGLLTLRDAEHVVVRDLELRHARPCNGSNVAIDPRGSWRAEWAMCGAGVALFQSRHVTIERMDVHDVWSWGWAAVGGAHLVVRESRFDRLTLCNEHGAGQCMRALWGREPGKRGWGQGLATGVDGRSITSHVEIVQNAISRSWGEAIDLLCAEHVTVAHNTIVDAWSSAVYLDNARHV
jgi:hypothetical protein